MPLTTISERCDNRNRTKARASRALVPWYCSGVSRPSRRASTARTAATTPPDHRVEVLPTRIRNRPTPVAKPADGPPLLAKGRLTRHGTVASSPREWTPKYGSIRQCHVRGARKGPLSGALRPEPCAAFRPERSERAGGSRWTRHGSCCGEQREPDRWPLRPEAKYGHGLPAPQHPWPGTGRPWVSTRVHRKPR